MKQTEKLKKTEKSCVFISFPWKRRNRKRNRLNHELRIQNISFYGISKIHKRKIINEFCKQSPGKYIHIKIPEFSNLRPIIHGPAMESNSLSNFIDVELTPALNCIRTLDNLGILRNFPKILMNTHY